MPRITVEGLELRYALDGPEGAPVVAFSNSLGATLEMWDPLLPALGGWYRALRYDTRGHGASATRAARTEISVHWWTPSGSAAPTSSGSRSAG